MGWSGSAAPLRSHLMWTAIGLALGLGLPGVAHAAEGEGHPQFGPILFGLAVLVMAAKAGGLLVERWGQPAVLGELVVGIALGNLLPQAFGAQGLAFVRSSLVGGASMPSLSVDTLAPLLLGAALSIGRSVLRIGLVVLAGYVGVRLLRAGLRRLEAILIRAGEAAEPVPGATAKRVATLLRLVETLALVLIWGLVVVIGLDQLGLDITPIVAGAGIVGLAVGFGAQNLVRDLIGGFFLVLENQVRVGDVAVVNGVGGLVEAITFRTIVLRDLSGVVHVFPNGTVNTLANMTKGWSAYRCSRS